MKAAVIGGGVGGIISALLLRKQGFEVELFEQAEQLGGRLAYQEGGGYRIDRGPTIVLLPDMLLETLALCGIDRAKIELHKCDPMYRIHYSDGTHIDKWSDIERQAEEIEQRFPGESSGFRQFMKVMGSQFEEARAAFLEESFVDRKRFFAPTRLRLLASMKAYLTARRAASRYFRDSRLIDAFSLQTLYIGGLPDHTPALYSLITYSEHAHGVWYLKGGYAKLVKLLEDELERQEIKVVLGARVDRLQVVDRVCRGLCVGGETKSFDIVVYNGDLPHLRELLPSAYHGPLRRNFAPSTGCLLLYAGVRRRWETHPAHQFFLPNSFQDGLRDISQGRLARSSSYYVFSPVQLEEEVAPDGSTNLYVLIPVPAGEDIRWDIEGPRLARHILKDMDRRGFPGLLGAMDWLHVRTPEDARNEGMFQGGSFGLAPTLGQSGPFRPQLSPVPVKQLYAVGASVHPGGGIPIVMQSARLMAQQVSKEMITWRS